MYPRSIQLTDEKIKKLIIAKGELVTKGRAVSEEIDVIEKDMAEINDQLIAEEKKVNIEDILEKEKLLTAKVEEAIAEMKVYKQEIFDRMKAQVPQELGTKYETLKKVLEDKETERNKIALKAQKYNDKIIPIGRELMKPFLKDQYEDYDSLYIEDGEVYATIFSHMADFKNNFKKK